MVTIRKSPRFHISPNNKNKNKIKLLPKPKRPYINPIYLKIRDKRKRIRNGEEKLEPLIKYMYIGWDGRPFYRLYFSDCSKACFVCHRRSLSNIQCICDELNIDKYFPHCTNPTCLKAITDYFIEYLDWYSTSRLPINDKIKESKSKKKRAKEARLKGLRDYYEKKDDEALVRYIQLEKWKAMYGVVHT